MTQIVILAAGRGTRMGSELPKVLVPLNGRPMIDYLISSVYACGFKLDPIVVVSPDNVDIIKEALKSYKVSYAIQKDQLGTGHAVRSARDKVSSEANKILVLYGDHPFLSSESITKFANVDTKAVAVAPTKLPNFEGWHANFYSWGRMVRNSEGKVKAIVELKDSSEEEKEITEVNPGFMLFNKEWLFNNIDKLEANNKAHEFYLTDMVGIAFLENYEIDTISIEPKEAMGINSLAELKIAEDLVNN